MTPRASRGGTVLLEVLVALMIVSVAGAAAMASASAMTRTVATAQMRERDVRAASAFLDDVSLWTRDDLDRHLGNRPEGRWRLDVERDAEDLYDVALYGGDRGPLLVRTTFYRRAADGKPDAR